MNENKLVKDRECIKCKHFFDCAGKPKGARCIKFEERKGKCIDCKHFKILYPPMGKYDNGQAKCEKHNLIVDYFSKQKLKRLTCIEEGSTT